MGEKYHTRRTAGIPAFMVVVGIMVVYSWHDPCPRCVMRRSGKLAPVKRRFLLISRLFAICSVFWDLYCAAPERREQCEHSSEAKAFHDYVRIDYVVLLMLIAFYICIFSICRFAGFCELRVRSEWYRSRKCTFFLLFLLILNIRTSLECLWANMLPVLIEIFSSDQQNAGPAPSPIGQLPPNEGMPGGPMGPSFFPVSFASILWPFWG